MVTEPADSSSNQNIGLNLSTNTTEIEDTNMEEEEKNGAEQRQPSDKAEIFKRAKRTE